MAKKKGKSRGRSRGRGKSRRGLKTYPKTVKGVWKRQPLLVKAGLGFTGLKIVTNEGVIANLKGKQFLLALKDAEYAATNMQNYYPLAYGVLGHWVAKQLGIKGL